ncbi:MAG: phage holin family protein [Gammaproteobacteria bacterium]|nr:phage holin family protein [Gammaproteobacteria bacterium]
MSAGPADSSADSREEGAAEDGAHPEERAAAMDTLHVLRILRKAGGSLLVQGTLHGQLLRLEWAQEKDRLLKMLLVTLLGFSCLICAMLALGALALLLSWETAYRIHVLVALVVLYFGTTWYCWLQFQRLSAASAQAFVATRAELEADIEMLRESL